MTAEEKAKMNIDEMLKGHARKVYAGIGSRETPVDVQDLMTEIAVRLDSEGWTLRSGGAGGADEAFEKGASRNKPEIFLPWRGFEGHSSLLHGATAKAVEIASRLHPGWSRLNSTQKKFIARNSHQVLGASCDDPSAFVLCWTESGAVSFVADLRGGTEHTVRVATSYGVPVYNLRRDDHRRAWEAFVDA